MERLTYSAEINPNTNLTNTETTEFKHTVPESNSTKT